MGRGAKTGGKRTWGTQKRTNKAHIIWVFRISRVSLGHRSSKAGRQVGRWAWGREQAAWGHNNRSTQKGQRRIYSGAFSDLPSIARASAEHRPGIGQASAKPSKAGEQVGRRAWGREQEAGGRRTRGQENRGTHKKDQTRNY